VVVSQAFTGVLILGPDQPRAIQERIGGATCRPHPAAASPRTVAGRADHQAAHHPRRPRL